MVEKIKSANAITDYLIEFPIISDGRGCLTPIEFDELLPFEVKSARLASGENIFSALDQDSDKLVIVLSGTAEIYVGEKHYILSKPNVGLYISALSKFRITNVALETVCLVLSANGMDRKLDLLDVKSKGITVDRCPVVSFLSDDNSMNLVSTDLLSNIPFAVKRIFYIYNIPEGVSRGKHAHETCHEVLLALKGGFDVYLDDGRKNRYVKLDDCYQGLLLPAGIWAEESHYKADTICLVFASEKYDASGYINTYDDFIKYRQDENSII